MTRADRLSSLKPRPAKAQLPPRAIGYRRLSKLEAKKLTDRSLGLAAQQTAIDACAARLGLPLAQTYTDTNVSGGLEWEERLADDLQLPLALAMIGKGDVLLVAKRDRLARNVLAIAMIERHVQRKGGRVVSASGEGSTKEAQDDPAAVAMAQMIDVFAQLDLATIRQRVKRALAEKKARGERVGNIAFGFRLSMDGLTLERHPKEQLVLQTIRQLRAAGCSCQAIADELAAQGLRTRGGQPWPRQRVHTLLRVQAS